MSNVVQHPMKNEPSSSNRVLSAWFRQLGTLLGGVAAIGAVTWVLAKQFFVTRDEYTQIYIETKTIREKLGTMEGTLKDQGTDIRGIRETLLSMQPHIK